MGKYGSIWLDYGMVTLGDTVWYYVNTTYLPASCSLESFQLPLYVGQLSIGGSSWIVGKLRYHMMHHDTTINIHKQHVNAVFWCVLWFSPYHLVECEWWPAAQTYVNKLWWRVQSPEKEVTKNTHGITLLARSNKQPDVPLGGLSCKYCHHDSGCFWQRAGAKQGQNHKMMSIGMHLSPRLTTHKHPHKMGTALHGWAMIFQHLKFFHSALWSRFLLPVFI